MPKHVPIVQQFCTLNLLKSTIVCHPGVTHMLHFVRSKNLPFSTEEVKKVCSDCEICSELKPKLFKPPTTGQLIKSLHPMNCLSIAIKGALPSDTRNKFLLTIVNEFFKFQFAMHCQDISSATVIKCLEQVFYLCGFPSHIFLKKVLPQAHQPHPIVNGQVER